MTLAALPFLGGTLAADWCFLTVRTLITFLLLGSDAKTQQRLRPLLTQAVPPGRHTLILLTQVPGLPVPGFPEHVAFLCSPTNIFRDSVVL